MINNGSEPIGRRMINAVMSLFNSPDNPESLISKNAFFSQFNEELFDAIADGDGKKVERLVDKNNVNGRTGLGSTPIHWSASKGNLSITHLLIDNGANVSARDKFGQTPLQFAVMSGMTDMVDCLLAYGADVDDVAGDCKGTPLYWAVKCNGLAMAGHLIAAGADVDLCDKWGNTPLHKAASNGNGDVVNLLLEAGADATLVNDEGKLPADLTKDHSIMVLLMPDHESQSAVQNVVVADKCL